MYKIEDNVPPPNVTRGTPEKYPCAKMEVGQSFFVSDSEQPDLVVKAMSYQNRKQNGRRFSTRRVDGGRRFWRVE